MRGRIFIRPVFCIRNVKDDPVSIFPIRLIAIDYILGLVMWTLIGRATMKDFLPENTNFSIHALFRSFDRSAG